MKIVYHLRSLKIPYLVNIGMMKAVDNIIAMSVRYIWKISICQKTHGQQPEGVKMDGYNLVVDVFGYLEVINQMPAILNYRLMALKNIVIKNGRELHWLFFTIRIISSLRPQ